MKRLDLTHCWYCGSDNLKIYWYKYGYKFLDYGTKVITFKW